MGGARLFLLKIFLATYLAGRGENVLGQCLPSQGKTWSTPWNLTSLMPCGEQPKQFLSNVPCLARPVAAGAGRKITPRLYVMNVTGKGKCALVPVRFRFSAPVRVVAERGACGQADALDVAAVDVS
jgi:hypothetical protein